MVPPSRSLTPIGATTPASLHASPDACVAGDGTVTARSSSSGIRAQPRSGMGVGGTKKRIVRHHSLREGREVHPLLAELSDLAHDLVDGCLAAIESRTQLHRSGVHNSHRNLLFRAA